LPPQRCREVSGFLLDLWLRHRLIAGKFGESPTRHISGFFQMLGSSAQFTSNRPRAEFFHGELYGDCDAIQNVLGIQLPQQAVADRTCRCTTSMIAQPYCASTYVQVVEACVRQGTLFRPSGNSTGPTNRELIEALQPAELPQDTDAVIGTVLAPFRIYAQHSRNDSMRRC
jgi:hypothetical protein